MRPPDSRPQIDAIMMIAPPPRAFMCGTASREARMAGNSVSSNAACHSASDVSRDAGAGGAADVVDQDVEAAERLDRCDRSPARSRRAVETSACTVMTMFGTPRAGFDLERGLGQALGAARADADAAALGDERARTGQPEAAARAGDDRDLVGQGQIHIQAQCQFEGFRGRR